MNRIKLGCCVGVALLAATASTPMRAQETSVAQHQRLAQEDLRAREPLKAIPELQAVVAAEPGNVEARANLGVLLYFQGRDADAVPHLRAAVAAKPGLWKIRSLLGMAERGSGDDQGGRADLEAAYPEIEDQKLKIQVGQNLIESYAGTGELEKASELIAGLLKVEPTNAALLYTSYRIHTDLAKTAMLELGLAAPDSPQIHQAMAHEEQRDHDMAGTIANLRKALELAPNLPGGHFELAEALHVSEDEKLKAQAEAEYRLAVAANPRDAKAWERLGDIQVEKENLAEGANDYAEALRLQPGQEDAAIGEANVLSEQGKPEQALPLLLQVEAADPSNVLAHYRLSVVYRKLKRPEDVKRELALYARYKGEREKLQAVYKQLRLVTPEEKPEKERERSGVR